MDKLFLGPLGAHTSAAGGVWNALLIGDEIGAGTVQLFTANQRQWQAPALSEEAIIKFHEVKKKTGLTHLMSHASYLLNLGSPECNQLEKGRQLLRREILRCRALGIHYLNLHPGAAKDGTQEACLSRIVDSLLGVQDLLEDDTLRVLVENTAGQGSLVGSNFAELAYILEGTAHKMPIGVCIDTCHLFAAGYDIRTEEAWDAVFSAFDKTIGLQYLLAFHLNDSLYPLGSKRDRHAPLGKGYIGLDSFHYLMSSPKSIHLPKYLETPGGPELWRGEIALLQERARNG